MTTDLAPFEGTVGGGFLIGFITGYAIKKVAAVIVGLFFATLAYLEYPSNNKLYPGIKPK
jgi:uncharacterized membrane protein (Fun14 family)